MFVGITSTPAVRPPDVPTRFTFLPVVSRSGQVSRCAKDKTKTARLPRTAAAVTPPAIASTAPLPLSEVVVEKEHLAKQALHNTSCAGCVASVRTLLARPLR